MTGFPKNNSAGNPDFWRLVEASCDGTLTEEEQRELELMVLSDSALRQQYAAYRVLHAELEWRYRVGHRTAPTGGDVDSRGPSRVAGQSGAVDVSSDVGTEVLRHPAEGIVIPPLMSIEHPLLGFPAGISGGAPSANCHALNGHKSSSNAGTVDVEVGSQPSSPVVLSFLQSAFCLWNRPASLGATVITASVVALLMAFAIGRPPVGQVERKSAEVQPAQTETPANYVARLTRVNDADWADPFAAPSVMSFLKLGQELELNAGSVEVTYKSGARVVLEGPVQFEVNSLNGLDLKSGRLAARVPEEARGFLVSTSVVDVVDLGTEFGVIADGQMRTTDLHVLTGEVDYRPKGDGFLSSVSRLVAGESVRIHAATARGMSIVEPVSYDLRTLAQLHTFATARSPLERWREASARLRQDRTLVAYYDFQDQGSIVRNVVSDRLHGQIISPSGNAWTSGRWTGKGGLAFGEELAQVVIDDAPELRLTPPFSIAVWVRPDADRSALDYPLIVGKGRRPFRNYSLWQSPEGRCKFSVYTEGGENLLVSSTSILPGNRWSFVVATVSETQMFLFIDGRFNAGLGRTRSQSICVSDDPLEIGRSSEQSEPRHAANISGVIDELAIFRRALTAEEVESLYKLGRVP